MRQYIPQCILEARQWQGKRSVFALFVDISRFTALTQALMSHGIEEVEVLSDAINRVFTPMIDNIHSHRGFVSGFAGHALTAVFVETDGALDDVYSSAVRIRQTFVEHGWQRTKFGDFELSVKMGIGEGSIRWQIFPTQPLRVYAFHGTAIEAAAAAEGTAAKNEIRSTNPLPFSDSFTPLPPHPTPSHLPPLNAADFVPETILQRQTHGEFRDVVACFIQPMNWNELIRFSPPSWVWSGMAL